MPTVNFTVAEPTARRIDERVRSGDYPDAATYIAELVARDRTDTAHGAALDAALDEGEASSVSGMTFAEILAEARADVARWPILSSRRAPGVWLGQRSGRSQAVASPTQCAYSVHTDEEATMHSALRKMGNSTGLIVPKAVLTEAGLTSGTTLDLVVEDGRIIATPVAAPRAGWAEAAAAITALPVGKDEADWRGFGIEGKTTLTWWPKVSRYVAKCG